MNNEKKSNKKGLIITLIALLVIGLVVAAILIFGKRYKVTFDLDDGSPVTVVKVKKGKKVTKPEDPVRDDYIFTGWSGKTEFDFDQPITDNVDLVATWEEKSLVYFRVNGEVYRRVEAIDGKVSLDDEPLVEGFAFKGWYIGDEAFDLNSVVTSIKYVDAKLVPLHVVIFENEGIMYETCNVPEGDLLPIPEAPEKEGYYFAGWLRDGKLFDFAKPIVEDFKLTSSFEQYALQAPETLTVHIGETKALGATIVPKSSAKITYSSSDEKIAKVDKNGKVTGVKGGTCIISAKSGEDLVAQTTIYVNSTRFIAYLNNEEPKGTVYLYYKANNRPIYNLTFLYEEYYNGEHYLYKFVSDAKIASDLQLSFSAPGPNTKVVHFNENDSELYATNFATVANGYLGCETFDAHFSIKNHENQVVSYYFDLVVETDINITAKQNCSIDKSGSNITIKVTDKTKPFKFLITNTIKSHDCDKISNYTYDYNSEIDGGCLIKASAPTVSDSNPGQIILNTWAGQQYILIVK